LEGKMAKGTKTGGRKKGGKNRRTAAVDAAAPGECSVTKKAVGAKRSENIWKTLDHNRPRTSRFADTDPLRKIRHLGDGLSPEEVLDTLSI